MLDQAPKADWEAGRVAEPMDFPAIVFAKLAALLMSSLGSSDRHRHLQDLADVLAPYQDAKYEGDLTAAAISRGEILRHGLKDGVLTLIEKKEAVDIHQRLWLAAIMRLMKRRNFLGEEWVRG